MKKTIAVRGRLISVNLSDWGSDDIDVESVTSIDYGNIVGEILTSHILLNRIGVLRAELSKVVSDIELDIKISASKFSKSYRDDNSRVEYNSAKKKVLKTPTLGEIESAMFLDHRYQECVRQLNEAKYDFDVIDALYWAVKSKDDKLKLFEHRLNDDDFDNICTKINGLSIKTKRSIN